MKYNKIIVLFIIILNILFTTGIFYLFYLTGNEPSTLIGAWFLFTTGELWALAIIKREEVKKDCDKGENENEE